MVRIKPKNSKAAGIFMKQVDDIVRLAVKRADDKFPVPHAFSSNKKIPLGANAPKVGAPRPTKTMGKPVIPSDHPRWGDMTRKHHGPPPPTMKRPHGHHTPPRNGSKAARKYNRGAQRILAKYGIDPIYGPECLTWAENAGHTIENARLTYEALARADRTGNKETILAVLKHCQRTLYKSP